MSKIPTDFEIMEEIHDRYYDTFRKYATEEPDRIARIRVPIKINEVAEAIGVEQDMIFGRVFYHFNKKYSYKDEKGDITTFFITDKFEGLSVNFALVASTLAEMKQEKQKADQYLIVSGTAIALSIFAIILAVL
ncbi:MAG: hypothetical protein CL666_01730 [Balneola sp.]|nr:hypothetical protein [Balneola sp.]|tara:strand:+ start:43730 stop:44131 length:402 start_codon:yes stop_codon:yes gene_type:complete